MFRQLTLDSFRCFGHQTIQFSGTKTAIVGPNGAGKSSIADALGYLVTGACRGTTTDGKGLDAVIRAGAETMEVSATVDGLGQCSRGIGQRMISRGPQRGTYTQEPVLERAEEILESLGVSRRIFDLAVRPDAFDALHGREQAEALMALAGIEAITLESLLAAGCPSTITGFGEHLDGGLGGFLAAVKAAEHKRHEAGLGAKSARGAYEQALADRSGAGDQGDGLGACMGQIAALRDRATDLCAEDSTARAEHAGRRRELARQQESLQRQISAAQAASKTVDTEALIAERAGLAERADSLRPMTGGKTASVLAVEIGLLRGRRNETADQVRGQVAGIRDELAEIEAKLATVQAQLQDCPEPGPMPIVARQDIARIAQLTDLLSGIDDLEEIECDRCGSTLEVEELQATLAELQEATATDRAAHAEWEQKRSARADLAVAVETGTARVNGLRSTLAEAEQKLAMVVEAEALEAPLAAARELEAADRRILEIDVEIARAESNPGRKAALLALQQQANEAAAALAELGEFEPQHTEELAQIRADMATLEEQRRTLEEAAREAQRLARLQANWDGEQANHDALNALVEALHGPVRTALFGEKLRALEDELREAMGWVGTLFGEDPSDDRVLYSAGFELDERGRLDLQLLRVGADGQILRLPAECCSESERVRLGWALQSIAARRARVVVLDSPEALDERFALAVYDLGDALANEGVQVIVCAVNREDRQPPEGWCVVKLDDGVVIEAGVRGQGSGVSDGRGQE
ncbi:MAG TPA: AAA family ATPase, partial [Thermoanaerobaculales bacterium]|nr:AAA family ATPase [Thermoanaerobaculales bacterium]